jgi:hypothetical protein
MKQNGCKLLTECEETYFPKLPKYLQELQE